MILSMLQFMFIALVTHVTGSMIMAAWDSRSTPPAATQSLSVLPAQQGQPSPSATELVSTEHTGSFTNRESALVNMCAMGDAKACYALGFAYKGASDLLEDAPKARKLMLRACELGSGTGCESVARMFASGYGGEQDNASSLAALDQGCEFKHAESCHMLGHRLIAPELKERYWDAAFNLFSQACELGNEEACDDVKLIEENTLGNSKSSKPANDSRRM